jgi:hypothetical protein
MKKQNHVLVNSVAFFLFCFCFFSKCVPATPAPSPQSQVSADIHEIMKTENFRQGVHAVQQKLARNARMNGSKKITVTDNDFKQSKAFQAAVKELQEKISEPVFERDFNTTNNLLNIVQKNITDGEIDKAVKNITRYSQQFEPLLDIHGESDPQIKLLRRKAGNMLEKCDLDKYARFMEILDRRSPEIASKIGLSKIDWVPYISDAINNLTNMQQAADKGVWIIGKIVFLPQEQQQKFLNLLETKILQLNKGEKTYKGQDISLETKIEFFFSKIVFWERQFDDQESEVYKSVERYSQIFDDAQDISLFISSIFSSLKSISSPSDILAFSTYNNLRLWHERLFKKVHAGFEKAKKFKETPTPEQEEEQESPREGRSEEPERLIRAAKERDDYEKQTLAQMRADASIDEIQEIYATFEAAAKGTLKPAAAKQLLSTQSKKQYGEKIAQAERDLRDATSYFNSQEFKEKLDKIALLRKQIQQAQDWLNTKLKEHEKKASALPKPKTIAKPLSPTPQQSSLEAVD